MAVKNGLSDTDLKILALLMQNSRRSLTELSASLGVSRQTIQNCMQRLIDREVIKRFTIEVADEVNTEREKIIFSLKLKENSCAKLFASIKNWPELLRCWTVTGDRDLVVVVEVTTSDDAERLRSRLYRHPNVIAVHTETILKVWKS